MKPDALKKVIDDIHSNNTTELLLPSEEIHDEQAIEIAEALTHNTSILTLDLSNNPIGHRGACALAKAIKVKRFSIGGKERSIGNNTLLTLNLSGTHITDLGAKTLAESLIGNKKLKHLMLANNQLKHAGTFAIVLNGNVTLESLDLSNNEFNDTQAKILLDGTLQGNRWGYHLTGERRIHIDLTGNNVSKTIRKKFNQCAKKTVYEGFVEGYKEALQDLHTRFALRNTAYPAMQTDKTTKENEQTKNTLAVAIPPTCTLFAGSESLPLPPSPPPGIFFLPPGIHRPAPVKASSFSSLMVPVSPPAPALINEEVQGCVLM